MDRQGKILTISIAAYNVEKYISNTLNSLICQKMDKLEVIIQNDGSTDRTADIVEEYVKKYPNTFILNNKKNGGYGSTINASLEMAGGKYFKQLDGDDWFDSSNLDAYIDLLEKIDADCVVTPFMCFYENDLNKTNVYKSKLHIGLYSLEEVMKSSNDIFKMHLLTYKMQLLRNIKMKILEKCFYTDQEYIMYPLIKAKNVFISNLSIYCYRLGNEGQSVSKTGIIKHYKDHIRVLNKILQHADEIEKCDKYTRKALKHHLKVLVAQQYIMYLTLPSSKEVKGEIAKFDNALKKDFPSYYSIPLLHHWITIKLLRCFNFKFYNKLSSKY